MIKIFFLILLITIAEVLASFNSTFVLKSPKQGRIVGGRDVSIFKYPYYVSVRYRHCTGCAYTHICGGSIHSENVVVTAAQCVAGRSAKYFLIVSSTENRDGADGVPMRVQRIVMHENYDPILLENDIAVLFLTFALLIDNVTIAAIPLANVSPNNADKAYVAGWGATTEGGLNANKLQEVDVPIVSNELCNAAYGAAGEVIITKSMICAGGSAIGGKDSCKYDTGGPLIVKRFGHLTGIVSWGRGCARPNMPGVYTNVAYFKNWILQTVNGQ